MHPDLVLENVRAFCAERNLRVFVLARKPRLRIRIEGAGYGSGLSSELEAFVPVMGYDWMATSGGQDGMNFSLWKKNENPWKEAADKRKEDDVQSGRRFPKANTSNCPFPHCDQRILHAPGECVYCDSFPVYQYYRQALGINFTGESDPKKSKCPGEIARNLHVIERWPNNRPMTADDIKRAEEETRKMFNEIAERKSVNHSE